MQNIVGNLEGKQSEINYPHTVISCSIKVLIDVAAHRVHHRKEAETNPKMDV